MSKKNSQIAITTFFQYLGRGFNLYIRPTTTNFNSLIQDPITKDDKTVTRLFYTWVTIFGACFSLLAYLMRRGYQNYVSISYEFLLLILWLIYVGAVAAFVGIAHMIATWWMGGRNTHTRFLYTIGGVILPGLVLELILPLIPEVYLSVASAPNVEQFVSAYNRAYLILHLYMLFLYLKAQKLIYRLSYARSFVLLVITLLVFSILAAIILIIFFSGIKRFIR